MIKYLKTYLDINEFENIETFIKIGQLIQQNPDLQIVDYNYKSFVLKNYKDLLRNKIDLETFFQAGDVYGTQKIFLGNDFMESLFAVYSDIESYKNCIIIVTDVAYNYFKSYSKQKLDMLQKTIAKNGSYLFVL